MQYGKVAGAFVVAFTLALGIANRAANAEPPASTQPAAAVDKSTKLRDDLTFTVLAAQRDAAPADKFTLRAKVPDGSYYFLQMDGISIGGGPSVVVSDEGAADSATAFQTGSVFTRKCVKLAPPKGTFVEVLGMFENTGNGEIIYPISSKEPGKLAISLRVSKDIDVQPVDFLAQGFSTSRAEQLKEIQAKGLTVVTETTGKMNVFLAKEDKGGKTWILLLFDVPKDGRDAALRVGDAEPIQIKF